MSLAEFEQEIVDDLYETLITDDEDKGITLYGDIGSGKSTIALNLANQLMEGWTIFYIEGIDPNLSPYLTWHIGTKLYSKKKLKLGSDISFGISFLPVPISLEFGTSISVTSTNYILTPSEEAIISNIEKYGKHENEVCIQLCYGNEEVGISIQNSITRFDSEHQKTGIGLQNISIMMEQMDGRMEVNADDLTYCIVLYFPEKKEYHKISKV